MTTTFISLVIKRPVRASPVLQFTYSSTHLRWLPVPWPGATARVR